MVSSEEHPLENVHLADCQRRHALRDQIDHSRLALHDRIHKQHAPAVGAETSLPGPTRAPYVRPLSSGASSKAYLTAGWLVHRLAQRVERGAKNLRLLTDAGTALWPLRLFTVYRNATARPQAQRRRRANETTRYWLGCHSARSRFISS